MGNNSSRRRAYTEPNAPTVDLNARNVARTPSSTSIISSVYRPGEIPPQLPSFQDRDLTQSFDMLNVLYIDDSIDTFSEDRSDPDYVDPTDPIVNEFLREKDVVDNLIDEDRREKLEEELERLVCPICHQPYQNPIVLVPCGHELCEQCLTVFKHNCPNEVKCPLCQKALYVSAPLTPAKRSRMFLNQSKYSVWCLFHFTDLTCEEVNDSGCQEHVKISEYYDHIRTCKHRPSVPSVEENLVLQSCPNVYRKLRESRRLEILEFISLWRDQSGGNCSNIEDTAIHEVANEMTQRFPEFDEGTSKEFVEWFCTQKNAPEEILSTSLTE